MKVKMNYAIDHKTAFNFIAFSIAVFFTFIFWLLLGKIFLPEKTEVNSQVTNLAQDLSLQLNSTTITLIDQKHSFAKSQLADFQIYLLNNKVNYNTGELSIKYFKVITPPDLAYSTLNQKKNN